LQTILGRKSKEQFSGHYVRQPFLGHIPDHGKVNASQLQNTLAMFLLLVVTKKNASNAGQVPGFIR